MSRVESRLPSIFYNVIGEVHNSYWMKFVRILGIPEKELQDLCRPDLQNKLTEQKYQALLKWKMYLGNVSDNEVSLRLEEARNEADGLRPCTYTLPTMMLKNREKARKIYEFVEEYDAERWKRIARYCMELKESDLVNLSDAYKSELSELKYQTVLRWIRVQGICDDNLPDALNQLEQRNIEEPSPTVQSM